ncbi:MAG: hypothetical protein V1725_08005 [archaeon]
MTNYLIGIAGRSCSGKTEIIKACMRVYPEAMHINQDLFFKQEADHWERPESVRFDLLEHVLVDVKQGRTALLPSTGWTEICDRLVTPAPLVFVEGFLLYTQPRITALFEKKIYLNVSNKNLLQRRLQRNGEREHGYIQRKVIPDSLLYERMQRQAADVVIDANRNLSVVTQYVLGYLDGILR